MSMIYGSTVHEVPIGGRKIDYRIKSMNGEKWVEIKPDHDIDPMTIDVADLTNFIDELMEIRDYINDHPIFQVGGEGA